MATPASGSNAQDSTLFLRKATGLVRSWSVFDAFVYAFFSINLVTLGLYSFSQMYYFEGGLLPTLLVSAVFLIFEIIVYASLISVMPRAGGDYVWQSRILGRGNLELHIRFVARFDRNAGRLDADPLCRFDVQLHVLLEKRVPQQ